MKIALVGAGWLGTKLVKYFVEKNHQVIATTTSPEKTAFLKNFGAEAHVLDFQNLTNPEFLSTADVVFLSMPISKNNWHHGFSQLKFPLKKVVLFSSTGIYPQISETFTETFSLDLRADILTSEKMVTEKYPQATVLRFGGLMGDERLPKNIFKNKDPKNPEKPVNYIHYEDILAIAELLIKNEMRHSLYNIVAPAHPTIAEILTLTQEKSTIENAQKARIISADRFIQEFNYKFIHPNPKYF